MNELDDYHSDYYDENCQKKDIVDRPSYRPLTSLELYLFSFLFLIKQAASQLNVTMCTQTYPQIRYTNQIHL